jgi:hypothetical protein
MKLTETTKRALACRREERDLMADGWEFVGEGGGKLWELQRGGRWNEVIKEVRISVDGKGLWVKTGKIDA